MITGLMSGFTAQTKDAKTAVDDLSGSFNAIPQATQKEIDLLNSLIDKNAALRNEIDNMGADEEEQLANNLALDLARVEAMRAQIDMSGALAGKLNEQLDQQKKLIEERFSEQELQLTLKNVDPLAKGIAEGVKDGLETVNDTVIPAFNNMFGTQIKAIDQETINTATKWTATISNGFIKAGKGIIDGFTTTFGIIYSVITKIMDPDFWNGLTEKMEKILRTA